MQAFFGMVRGAGGGSTHPESTQFIQIFRLLSLYSLVKPPKGSNVSGADMLQSLLNVKDLHTLTKLNRKQKFEEAIDEIMLQGNV